MSDFTDEDVQRASDTLNAVTNGGMYDPMGVAQVVLAAVLPEYDKRVRAQALREAADDLDMAVWKCWEDHNKAVRLVRARADAEEGK
jgi:hypothetical protein